MFLELFPALTVFPSGAVNELVEMGLSMSSPGNGVRGRRLVVCAR